MANTQIFPPAPGAPGFLEHLAEETRKFDERYRRQGALDPDILLLGGYLAALVKHLAIRKTA
jgi:hypothetical protein